MIIGMLYLEQLNSTIAKLKVPMDMEHWSGFTDVELNSLKQRGRGRRNTRRSRGQPLNQGARKIIYPIGRAGNDATKANVENLPSGAFFSHDIHSSSRDVKTIDKSRTDSDICNDAESSVAEKSVTNDNEKDSVSTENSSNSGVALTERS